MKTIKKLFKFLPAMCLAVLSGLSAVLFEDHKLNSTYADNENVVIDYYHIGNYVVDYEKYEPNAPQNRMSFHYSFDFDITLYKRLSDNNYYYGVTVEYNYSSWYLLHSGNTFYLTSYPNQSALPDVSYNFVTDTFTLSNDVVAFYNTLIVDGFYTYMVPNGPKTPSQNSNDYWYLYTLKVGFNLLGITATDDLYSFTSLVPNDYVYLYYYTGSTSYNFPVGYIQYVDDTFYTPQRYIDLSTDSYAGGYQNGYNDGYNNGYNTGYNEGYQAGNTNGYDNGYQIGYTAGVESQQPEITDAYNDGYADGYNNGFSADTTATTIFSGILQVGMLPINFLLAIFNFEILGINLSAFISAILTVCLTVIVIRNIKGGGD